MVFGPSLPWAVAGALLWGAGAALGFPVGMSAAGDDPARAAGRVSVVASIGYTAFLAGPPLVGFLAEQTGILRSLLVVFGALALALLTAGATASAGTVQPAQSSNDSSPAAMPTSSPTIAASSSSCPVVSRRREPGPVRASR